MTQYWATEYTKLNSSALQKATYPFTAFAKGFYGSAKTIPKDAVNGIASFGRSTARRVVDTVKNPIPAAAGMAKSMAVNAAAYKIHPTVGAAVTAYQNVPWAQVADAGRAVGRTVVKPFDAGMTRSLRLKSKLKPDLLDRLGSAADTKLKSVSHLPLLQQADSKLI